MTSPFAPAVSAPPIRQLLWDWNGTLLDDVEHCVATVNRLLAGAGKPLTERGRYREIFEFPVIRYYEALGLPTEPTAFEALSAQFVEQFNDGIHACEPHRGAVALMEGWHAAGRPQAVLSATRQDHLERLITAFGLTSYFEALAGIGDIFASGKLASGRALLARLGWEPASTLLIGDTTHDAEVAEALGVHCLLVACGHQSPSRLRRAGTVVIEEWSSAALRATPYGDLAGLLE